MLLSIDRVLQLLAEGKSSAKIAELADCLEEDILALIAEARILLAKYEKTAIKKKIILKKKTTDAPLPQNESDEVIKRLLAGAELTAVPTGSKLTFYVAGSSVMPHKNAGFGIVIHDNEARQVGKLSVYIGKADKYSVIYTAIMRSLQIADYFGAKDVRIRMSSGILSKHFNEEISISDEKLSVQRDDVKSYMSRFSNCVLETISVNQNDKAMFLAAKAVERANAPREQRNSDSGFKHKTSPNSHRNSNPQNRKPRNKTKEYER